MKLPEIPTFKETENMKLTGIITPEPIEETAEEVAAREQEEQEAARLAEEAEKQKTPGYLDDNQEDNQDEPKAEANSIISYVKGLIDLGVLNTPENFEIKEDFTEAQLQELLDYDAKARDEESQSSFLSKIKDPRVLELAEFSIKGGEFADAESFFKLQKQEESFEKIDLTVRENQELIVLEALKRKGINPKRAKDMLDLIVVNDELESEATALKNEFIEATKLEKQKLAEIAERSNKLEQQRQEAWRNDFYKSLEATKFKQEKKSEILSSFNNVRFENGETMPKWRYKMMQIQNNPGHFMEFLDLLSLYNPEKGFNPVKEKAAEIKQTEAANSLFSKLKTHATGMKVGKGGQSDEVEERFIPTNPADRNVRIK